MKVEEKGSTVRNTSHQITPFRLWSAVMIQAHQTTQFRVWSAVMMKVVERERSM